MKQNSISLVVGRRNIGKSTLLMDLIHKTSDKYERIIYFTHKIMMQTDSSFIQKLPKNVTVVGIDDEEELKEWLLKIIYGQKMIIETKHYDQAKNGMLIVFENVLNLDKKIQKDNNFAQLVNMNKHLRISLIFVLQYLNDLAPTYRNAAESPFFCGESNDKGLKLYKEFCGWQQDFASFSEVFQHYTDNYGIFVLDRWAKSNGQLDGLYKFKWYKANIY